MNVNLTPQLEAMVRQKVESGLYNNASEVVREALRLMEERDRRERLRAAIAVADEQFARRIHDLEREFHAAAAPGG